MKAAQKAYSTLRAGIIEGKHLPGSRIKEQEIAASAGVSRTPVREALRRLEAEAVLSEEIGRHRYRVPVTTVVALLLGLGEWLRFWRFHRTRCGGGRRRDVGR